ncbi:hypothetical protein [Bdellovibrio sp. HCB209]|uniref:hypothetical protein n=1 Tax=Bdellovibrio sp. HCB209 TaxID=3394354 RepID=UPI0039B5D3FF
MKLILSILLMTPIFASAATEIIYNRSANPFVPAQGFVSRDQVCIDQDNDLFLALNPQDASVMTAPRVVEKEVCIQWNRNDSSRPQCTSAVLKPVPVSDTYEQLTFEQSDYRKERPIKRQTKRIENCH